eukprot:g18524.t1
MINDAHNRLYKYEWEILRQKSQYLNTMDQQWSTILEQTIVINQCKTKTKKRPKLQEKRTKLIHHKDKDNNKPDTWIGNLSSRQLTETEKAVLLHYNHKAANRADFMVALETTLKDNRLMDKTQQAIRQTIIPTLHRKNKGGNLNTLERKALDKLKKDKNIVIVPADKGHMTIIMNKPDYVKKAQALFADTTTYQQVAIDSTPQLSNRITQTLKRLKDAGQITKTD